MLFTSGDAVIFGLKSALADEREDILMASKIETKRLQTFVQRLLHTDSIQNKFEYALSNIFYSVL